MMIIDGLTQPMMHGWASCWAVACWMVSTGPAIGGDGPRPVQPEMQMQLALSTLLIFLKEYYIFPNKQKEYYI